MKKIVILGAGYGGLLTAKKLEKKLKKQQVCIQIIDKNPYHTMLTELHEVVASRVSEESIKIDLDKVFAHRNVEVILDEIESLDFKNKKLISKNKEYNYDYLVVATGCKPTYFGIEGAKEFTKPLWSYEDAITLKEHILRSFRKAAKEIDQKKKEELLSFVVVGAGFTGVEMIAELGEYTPRLCKTFGIDQKEVHLKVVDAMPTILPIFPEKLIKKAQRALEKLNIEVITGQKIVKVEKEGVVLEEKGLLKAETIIWAAGVESSELLDKIEIQKEARNRIKTNEFLQSIEYKDVYVVGDNIFYIPENEKRPVPQMVENAEHSASLVANNISSDFLNIDKKPYKPEFHGAMVCIGGRYGVASIGSKGKFISLSGFFAMFVKHFINIVYFMQVAGINKCFSYLKHEIFTIKDNRSFVGGHFSNSSPNFFLVPLRLFVGAKWLIEGFEKIQKVISNPSNIFLIPAPISATSSASKAAETATAYASPLPVPEFISSVVKWSMNTFFYTGDGGFTILATIFQTGMVCAELAVGLMFLGGFLTPFASIISILMGLMIWSSGMAPTEMLWYMVASIALMGNAGNSFGMDYYLLPYLNKFWKKIKWIKKHYFYID